jgi:hypothetical protein
MNERIQELAYEAEELADTEVDKGSEFHPTFCRIFAELIVRECADIASINQFQSDEVGNYVRKHFGVE